MLFHLFRILILLAVCLFGTNSHRQDDTIDLDLERSQQLLNIPAGFYFFIQQTEIQAELELTTDQLKQLKSTNEKIEAKLTDYRKSLGTFDPTTGITEEQQTKLDQMQQIMAKDLEAVDHVLLPHQQKRLKQIAFQYTVRPDDPTELYLAPKIADGLKLTQQQKSKISDLYQQRNEKIREAYREFEKQFVSIQQQSHQELLKILDNQQRAAAEEHIGPDSNLLLPASRIGFTIEQQSQQDKNKK